MRTMKPVRPVWQLLWLGALASACHLDAARGTEGAGPDADVSALLDAGEDTDGSVETDAGSDESTDAEPNDTCEPGSPADCGVMDSAVSVSESGHDADHVQPEAAVQAADNCADGARCADVGAPLERCPEGLTRCRDDGTLETCTHASYLATACAHGCGEHALGADCLSDLALTRLTGSVRYERRLPNETLTDFSATPDVAPAAGVLVLSYRADTLIDAVLSSVDDASAGSFEVRVPASARADDHLVVMAAATDGAQLIYAVADPGYAASTSVHVSSDSAPDPRIWSWSYALGAVTPGQSIVIPVALGSGALAVFASVRRSYERGSRLFAPESAQTIVAWLGIDTIWECGSCMASDPVQVLGHSFLHQLWLDGSADQGYWSDAVTSHELGHYLLGAFSAPPTEAGPHYLGVPTHPGLAWSEGWATFWSSWLRASPIYYDKQEGTFFWFNIDSRTYSSKTTPWQRAVAIGGLEQLIDENEVSALLWGSFQRVTAIDAALQVLGSPRLRVPPFERGYTERIWNDANHPEIYVDTEVSHVYLADYLDALRCAQLIDAEALDAVTEPSARYPYPSRSPLCR